MARHQVQGLRWQSQITRQHNVQPVLEHAACAAHQNRKCLGVMARQAGHNDGQMRIICQQ